MRYQQLTITEPVANFRALARQGFNDRWGDVFFKGFLYILVVAIPIMILYALSGWLGFPGDNMSKFTEIYTEFLLGNVSPDEYTRAVSDLFNGAYTISWLYQLLVSGAFAFGVAAVFLRYRRKQEAPAGLLFSGFSQYSRTLALFLLTTILTILWSLLFIIPGIIAAYRYRLAYFILVDNPDIGPLDAIGASKELMRGNKWKLFCLDLSFIGWAIVAAFANVVITMPILTAMAFGSATHTGDGIGALSDLANTGIPTALTSVGASITFAILTTLVSAVTMGLLCIYMGTASAAFYERAGGLLKYTDEVGAGRAPYGPPQQLQ